MSKLQKSIDKGNIKPFYDEWSIIETKLQELFSTRKKGAEQAMLEGIILYQSLLDQCNSDEERIEPLNHAERIQFIKANPSSYAAFRQLQELFKEMDKKLAAKRAMHGKLKK